MLVDPDRTSQALFAASIPNKSHEDDQILRAQEWVEAHYRENIKMVVLAGKSRTSLRQFNRRFRAATGETAVEYLQHTRVEAATILLITTGQTFDGIAAMVG